MVKVWPTSGYARNYMCSSSQVCVKGCMSKVWPTSGYAIVFATRGRRLEPISLCCGSGPRSESGRASLEPCPMHFSQCIYLLMPKGVSYLRHIPSTGIVSTWPGIVSTWPGVRMLLTQTLALSLCEPNPSPITVRDAHSSTTW